MPELAEVEYYRKQWDAGAGGTVRDVLTHPHARIYRDAPASSLRRALVGRPFCDGRSHGKRLLFRFDGEGGAWLGIHLGMTGRLFAAPAGYEPESHDHLVLALDGVSLAFADARMFGRITLDVTADGAPPAWWRELPPGILDSAWTRQRLADFVRRFPRTPLKTLLLDQRGFPGIGNWMADEICWRLRTAPGTLAGELDEERVAALRRETRRVARDAIRVIGEDWGPPPKQWLMARRWKDGGHCPRCGTELKRQPLRGRTTCHCPSCQA